MNQLESYLAFKCTKGLEERIQKLPYKINKTAYTARLSFEMNVISKMGYIGYFLVVQDFINWAKKQDILVGDGRGSGAGSLAAFALGITNVDPIKYDLYFERFLNPARVSMPDFDIDFQKDRRDEVIQYVKQRYGEDKVAQIGTFGTFKAKNSIKAVARTLGFSINMANALCKIYPKAIHGKEIKLKDAFQKINKLQELRNSNTDEGQVLRWAEQVEGRIASFGIHASGIVISSVPLTTIVPLAKGKNNEVVTQWDMSNVEDIGLIKFDFLGLKTLSQMAITLKHIRKNHGVDIDLTNLDLEDTDVYATLRKGDNIGIFQIEASSGIRDLTIKVRPTCIEDLAAIVAMYRPGPLCLTGDTKVLTNIKRSKNKLREFTYTEISSLVNTDSLVSYDSNTGKLVKNKIVSLYKSGSKEVYKLNVQTGLTSTQRKYIHSKVKPKMRFNQIKSSINHKFLTLDGWKALGKICPGEYICVAHHSGFGRSIKGKIYGKKNFKNIAFRHWQYRCVFCDWNLGALDVNHVDGNRLTNNSPENLSFLCPNHHRQYSEKTITKEELVNEREKYRLPYFDEIMYVRFLSKDYVGIEDTFDVEMTSPLNNFIAGDFVVHNSSSKMQDYLNVRAGLEKPTYHHPDLEPILQETGGWLVYQEQAIRIVKDLAGFSLAEADLLRRAIGKKKEKEMAEQYQKFKLGMLSHKYSEGLVSILWKEISDFADYSFNKSHAVGYAITAYKTAWLKTKYPIEFMAAALSCDTGNQDQMIIYIQECKRMGIPVLPPDVNESELDFTSLNKTIRFGLSAIKNVGEAASIIIAEREARGPFKDFFDFADRIDLSAVNKKKLESLVAAGAFDFTHHNRATLLLAVDQVIDYKNEWKKYISKIETFEKKQLAFDQREEDIKAGKLSDKNKPLKSLKILEKPIAPIKPECIVIAEMPLQEILKQEKELTGSFISGHPLDRIKRKNAHTIMSLREDIERPEYISLVAILSDIQLKETKEKKRMAFLKFEDLTGTIEGAIFPSIYDKYSDNLIKNVPLLLGAKVDYTDIETEEGEILTIPMLIIQKLGLIETGASLFRETMAEVPLDISNVLQLKKTLDKIGTGNESLRLKFITGSDTVLSPSNLIGISNERAFRTVFHRQLRK